MIKPEFVMTILKHLRETATQLKTEFGENVNGNRINAVIRKVEKEAYDSGFFATGEVSKDMLDHHMKPYKLQDSPNWREIFINYLKIV